jgi:heat shock protein HtpX
MTGRDNSDTKSHLVYFVVTFVLEVVLGILGTLVVMAYSRHREFAADAGSASFVGKDKMINALRALQRIHPQNLIIEGDPKIATLKIDGKS